MNAKRLLAKMTARGMSIGVVGGGSIEISRAEVAAALSFAGVSVTADRLVRLAYCGDNSQVPLLKAALVHEVRSMVSCDRPMRYRMVTLALCEVMGKRLCRTCNGVGTVAARQCTVCDGAGLKAWSQRARAAALDLPQTTFRREFEQQANIVYQCVSNMEQQALSALSRQFADLAA